jgi:serine phosphatase RsbU (regulator of sigma subunit)
VSSSLSPSIVQLLRELDSHPPFALLDVLSAHLDHQAGARHVGLWLTDYQQQTLRCWSPPGEARGEPVDMEDEVLGETFRSQKSRGVARDGVVRVYAPVTIRAERIGVLEVHLPHRPELATMSLFDDVATVLAYVLLAARRYTDVFERTRRSRDLEVPAELQWELLPVLAHEGPDFTIAGSLEPAYDIGGDHFDYAVEPDGLYVSIADAMGHGMTAALLSSLEVAVMRNSRRRGLSVRQQVRAANLALHDQFGGDRFITHLALRINRHDGWAGAVNAGHSLAYLLRGDVVGPVELAPDVPIGLFEHADFTQHTLTFKPGDRLLLVTDGVLEAAPDGGAAFGADGVAELLRATVREHPSEVVRTLTGTVMQHRAAPLVDDATAVCVDYRRR